MLNTKTVTTLVLTLGLSALSPAVYADHHEGSGMEHAGHEAKHTSKSGKTEAASETKAEEAAATPEAAMSEGGKMAEETAEKMSEGSH